MSSDLIQVLIMIYCDFLMYYPSPLPHQISARNACTWNTYSSHSSCQNQQISLFFSTGKTYTMIGMDSSTQSIGIAPCAISWLFKLINERKEKTGTRFSVRVSAVEIYGKDESLQDLLSDVPTGSMQDGQSPGVYLREDPICGTQVNNFTVSLIAYILTKSF